MPKALADQKAKERTATMKKGITKAPPKHRSSSSPMSIPPPMREVTAKMRKQAVVVLPPIEIGVDGSSAEMVHYAVPINPMESIMTEEEVAAKAAAKAEAKATADAAKTEKDAAAKARADQATAAKVMAAAAKAKKLEEQTQKREAEAVAKAQAKAEREARLNETKEQREARAAELKANGRTYTGSMLALAERVKSGAYVKSLTGHHRSNDELAVAFDAVPPQNVVKMGMEIFGEDNKYATLNIGQQSMNYRNRMRGAIKGAKVIDSLGGPLTLDHIIHVRDANGYATGDQAAAERADKKAAQATRKQEAEVAKAATKAESVRVAQEKATAKAAAEEQKKTEAAAKRAAMAEKRASQPAQQPGA